MTTKIHEHVRVHRINVLSKNKARRCVWKVHICRYTQPLPYMNIKHAYIYRSHSSLVFICTRQKVSPLHGCPSYIYTVL